MGPRQAAGSSLAVVRLIVVGEVRVSPKRSRRRCCRSRDLPDAIRPICARRSSTEEHEIAHGPRPARNRDKEIQMRRIIHRRPTPALVVALVALMLALSGSATAALVMTGSSIKDGTITGKDLANRTLGSKKLSKRASR